MTRGLKVYPQTETISTNSLIIIEGVLKSQKILTSLNDRYSIYLQSQKQRVELNVKEINVGMAGLTQAILVPRGKLKQGEKYELILENLCKTSEWHPILNHKSEYKSVSWTVDESDNEKPRLKEEPKLVDLDLERFGCGPKINAEFQLSLVDDSEVWVKTEFLDLDSMNYHTYYLFYNGTGNLKVGRNMCTGAFNYKTNGKYKVRFSFMDGCGNTDNNRTNWIEYNSPTYKK